MNVTHGLNETGASGQRLKRSPVLFEKGMTLLRTLPLCVLLLLTGARFATAQAANPGPDMVVIRGGTFAQGSPEHEAGRRDVEGPQHPVELASFKISRTEVTVADFRHFVESSGYLTDAERDAPTWGNPSEGCFSHLTPGAHSAQWVPRRSWRDPGYPQEDTHPVVCVSWNDAQAYIRWLSELAGSEYRLPSESEFEYAHRAGMETPWPWPSDVDPCLFSSQAERRLIDAIPDWRGEAAQCDDGYPFTAPVGTFPPNDFDLMDMAGNVSEWVQDCWHENYAGAPSSGSAWELEEDEPCEDRVLKGGDFVSSPSRLRSAHRSSIHPAFRTYHAGFRIAESLGEPTDPTEVAQGHD